MTKTEQLIDSASDLVNWLNGNGLTNKSRRGRVPSAKLERLEDAIATLEAELAEQKEEELPKGKYHNPKWDLEKVREEQKPLKGEYFVKVYIKSEDDLPEKGRFYLHEKLYEDTFLRVWDLSLPHRKMLLNHIDWYLLPVDAPPKTEFKPVKSTEEINQLGINYASLRIKEFIDSGLEPSEEEFDDIVLDFIRGYNACKQDFASQFKTDLREELIKFVKDIDSEYGFTDAIPIEMIDKYLKTKQ